MRLPSRVSIVLIADRSHHAADAIAAGLEAVFEVVPGEAVRVVERTAATATEPTRARMDWLMRLKDLTSAVGAELVVSRRVDLALASGLGVHLPENGLPAEQIRAAWPGLVIGRSCHDRQGLVRAEGVADYALLSPLAAPHSKPATSPILGIDGFGAAVRGLAIPVFALGGVLPEHAAPLRRLGAAGVALMGGAFDATHPRGVAERVRALHRAWLAAG